MLTKGNSMDSTCSSSSQQNIPPLSQGQVLTNGRDMNGSKLKRAETIECIVVGDDGQRMPADIDLCNNFTNSQQRRKTLNSIVAQIELQAEVKRKELRALILEHQKLVSDIERMEIFKQQKQQQIDFTTSSPNSPDEHDQNLPLV